MDHRGDARTIPGPSSSPRREPPDGCPPPVLASLACFASCDAADLAPLARIAERRRVPARRTVFRSADACTHVFVLVAGAIKLTRCAAAAAGAGKETVMDLIARGTLFGESALFAGRDYGATATAIDDAEVIAIPAAAMLGELRSNPALAWSVLDQLGSRVRGLLDRVERQASHSVEQRVAALLLERSDAAGVLDEEIDGCRRRDLAGFLAIRPETLSRIIGHFRREGWLSSADDGHAQIDRDALDALLPGAPLARGG